jgi:hypothetical protein
MKQLLKPLALVVGVLLLAEALLPVAAFALTGGPSQPEFSSFTPASTSEMVDPFSGDFTYNIPLMDVDGFPLNLAYRSGVSMDQEASWVGRDSTLRTLVLNMRFNSPRSGLCAVGTAVSMRNTYKWGATI